MQTAVVCTNYKIVDYFVIMAVLLSEIQLFHFSVLSHLDAYRQNGQRNRIELNRTKLQSADKKLSYRGKKSVSCACRAIIG